MAEMLSDLENESMYVIREAYRKFPSVAMLWSMGKDSTVLLRLTKKVLSGPGSRLPLTRIGTARLVWPGWKVNVPVAMTKSAPGNPEGVAASSGFAP